MEDRRKLKDQAKAGEALEVLTQRKPPRRDRGWETEQRDRGIVVTYRGIPAGVQARIKGIAGELGVNIGELARALLEYGLDAYERGDLELEPVEVARKSTLYPGQ